MLVFVYNRQGDMTEGFFFNTHPKASTFWSRSKSNNNNTEYFEKKNY